MKGRVGLNDTRPEDGWVPEADYGPRAGFERRDRDWLATGRARASSSCFAIRWPTDWATEWDVGHACSRRRSRIAPSMINAVSAIRAGDPSETTGSTPAAGLAPDDLSRLRRSRDQASAPADMSPRTWLMTSEWLSPRVIIDRDREDCPVWLPDADAWETWRRSGRSFARLHRGATADWRLRAGDRGRR